MFVNMTAHFSTNLDALIFIRKYVVHKTKTKFSTIALDHAHKQYDAIIKSDVGAVELT